MVAEDEAFNPDVPALPDGWDVDQSYDTTVRIHSPDGCALDHMVIQRREENGEYRYAVTPMMYESEGVSKSNTELGDDFGSPRGAVKYAVGLAERFANR